MTAPSPTVKMAACLQQDGDSSDSDKPSLSSHPETSRQAAGGTQGGAPASSATQAEIKLQGDKVTPAFLRVVVGNDWQAEGGEGAPHRGNFLSSLFWGFGRSLGRTRDAVQVLGGKGFGVTGLQGALPGGNKGGRARGRRGEALLTGL